MRIYFRPLSLPRLDNFISICNMASVSTNSVKGNRWKTQEIRLRYCKNSTRNIEFNSISYSNEILLMPLFT